MTTYTFTVSCAALSKSVDVASIEIDETNLDFSNAMNLLFTTMVTKLRQFSLLSLAEKLLSLVT